MSLIELFPAYWAMAPEALRRVAAEAAAMRGAAGREQGRQVASPGAAGRPYRLEDGLAVIPIQGSLLKEYHYPPFWTSYVVVRYQLEAALTDPEVRAVLLDIDSPGGSVAGFQDLAEAVLAARGRKPVYAWTDGQACSGAYGVACGAKSFAASPMAEVGSVGVVWFHSELSKYDERIGLTVTVLRSGEFKALGNDAEPLDAKAREVHQAQLDGMYALFRDLVVRARGVSAEKYEDWAEGRVFLAGDAVSVGLLDRACARDEFLSFIKTEVNMNAAELRSQFPEAVKAIEEGAAKAAADAAAVNLAKDVTGVVNLAGVLLGEEAKGKLSAAVEAGINAEQAVKLGLAAKAPEVADPKQDMLTALLDTDQPGVKAGSAKPAGGVSPLMAAIQARFSAGKRG
jgi:signal peptide peptidase SppA